MLQRKTSPQISRTEKHKQGCVILTPSPHRSAEGWASHQPHPRSHLLEQTLAETLPVAVAKGPRALQSLEP